MLQYMSRKTEKFFKTLFPPFIRDHIGSVDCMLGYKATVGRRSRMKGGNDVLKNFSVFRLI